MTFRNAFGITRPEANPFLPVMDPTSGDNHMLKRILPKETCFFDFFEEHNLLAVDASRNLMKLSGNGEDISSISSAIKELESKADKITHACVRALHRTFITPFDRDDIQRLIHRLDDVIDLMEDAVACMQLYEVKVVKVEVQEFANILFDACRTIGDLLKSLRHIRDPKPIIDKCVYISKLEHEADAILRTAIARLFKEEKDTFTLIKWKEIFELLEKATDKCHDVSNVIEGIVVEAS